MLSIQYFFIYFSDLSIFCQFSSKFVILKIRFFKKKIRAGPEFLGLVRESETQVFFVIGLIRRKKTSCQFKGNETGS